jgi:CRP-like cAMP-binding protein
MLAELEPVTLRDRLLLLRSMESLRPLDDAALMLLAEHARTRQFRAGETLLEEGHPVEKVYVVTAGRVMVTRRGKRLALVDRGRGAGFTSMLGRDPEGVLAVAEVPTQTIEIPAEIMLDAYEQDFSFVRNVLRLQAAGLLDSREGLPVDPDHPPTPQLGTWREHEPTLVERLMAMIDVPLFSGASLDASVELLRHAVEARYPAGSLLWQLGDASTFNFRIDYGRVRCTSAAGRTVEVGAGHMIGMMDCLAGQPRPYEARAETPVIGYRGNVEALLAVLEAHFDLAMEFVAVLARQRLR